MSLFLLWCWFGLRPEMHRDEADAMSVEAESALYMTKKKKHKHNKHDVHRKQRLKQQHNKQRQQ